MLHVTFTGSGAGFLRQALWKLNLRDRVVTFPDDLSFGPIDPPDPNVRSNWAATNLQSPYYTMLHENKLVPAPPILDVWRSIAEETEEFWSVALATRACTVWFTRRVPSEYCGFLAWVERADPQTYRIVDVTDATSGTTNRLIHSISQGDQKYFNYKKYLDDAAPLNKQSLKENMQLWMKLRNENSSFRIISDSKIVSVPLMFFDDLLLSRVNQEWQKMFRVAAETVVAICDERATQGNFEVMMGRLMRLVDSGRVEFRGNVDDFYTNEIRLPACSG